MTPDDLVLAWPAPAANWFEAAPVGNGRLGAMVFGGTDRARLQINDATVWSGTPYGPADALAAVVGAGADPDRLAEIRAAIRAEDYRRAEALLMTFEGDYTQEYLPWADLWLSLDGDGEYQGRTLNLDNGVVTEEIQFGDRFVTRTTWASRPASAVCVAITVRGGTVDLGLNLTSPLHVVQRRVRADGLILGIEIPIDGAPRHEPAVAEPLRYAGGATGAYDPFGAIVVRIDTDGSYVAESDSWLTRGMTRALITVGSSTSAEDAWARRPGTLPSRSLTRSSHRERAEQRADGALVPDALAVHEADLRPLLGTTSVRIGERRSGTVEVGALLSGVDEQLLATVMCQYGRYLLASASRPGGPPANLQGLWNGDLRPAWSSNYTININTEMNYWAAESTGLTECHEPLFDLIDRLTATGAQVAGRLYGAGGWVAHHNTDMWGWALPVGMGHGNPSWAIWMMGGVWLSEHVWDHFDFTRDTDFLRDRAWPVLRGGAEFCLDWLVEDGDWLDTMPSTSPENLFVSRAGTPESLSVSTAMDMALIRSLFTHCLAGAAELGIDDPITARIRSALPRLRPTAVTADGRLREWVDDHVEADPHHRHMSQMVAVYPLGQIDPDLTPRLADAAARTLDARGPGAMGWSWAWKIALRARLGDAATARSLLLEATRPWIGDPTVDAPVDGSEWGGLLPNLFSTHPPFQIDGNYGMPAAITEMLVQSHNDVIRVLPALPSEWLAGSVHGVRCRGGLAVDVAWEGGELTSLAVHGLRGGSRKVRVTYRGHTAEVTLAAAETVHFGPKLADPC